MSLGWRQNLAYEDTVSLYKPYAPTGGDIIYPTTATYTAVRCMLIAKPEVASGGNPQGRDNQSMIFTLDVFRFDATQEIGDGWAIKLTTATHPLVNTWWKVQGVPEIRPVRSRRRPGFAKILAKTDVAPFGAGV